jgi:hypothetical protein
VYTASGDGLVHSYEARSGTLKNKFAGHEYAVNCIAVSIFEAVNWQTVNQLLYCLSSMERKEIRHASSRLSNTGNRKNGTMPIRCVFTPYIQ